uniref:Uncharacterized protein n=1 Tax=Arundo donax TaxID=35708 RepID=A0A0A9QPI1_ARUDO
MKVPDSEIGLEQVLPSLVLLVFGSCMNGLL